MSNVSIVNYTGWLAYDTFLIVLFSSRPVYDPNPLRPNLTRENPCRIRDVFTGWVEHPYSASHTPAFIKPFLFYFIQTAPLLLLQFFLHRKAKNGEINCYEANGGSVRSLSLWVASQWARLQTLPRQISGRYRQVRPDPWPRQRRSSCWLWRWCWCWFSSDCSSLRFEIGICFFSIIIEKLMEFSGSITKEITIELMFVLDCNL